MREQCNSTPYRARAFGPYIIFPVIVDQAQFTLSEFGSQCAFRLNQSFSGLLVLLYMQYM
jgi:hypothetical protein